MPASKWIVEPTNLLQRKPFPPDKFDDFTTYNQLSLVTIVRQLSQISLISNKLFEELSQDCTKLAERTVRLNEKIKRLDETVSRLNAKKVKIPISSVEKCRSIKEHYAIEQIIDQKLFTSNNRPICITHRLEIISRLDREEKQKPVTTPVDPPEPIYTGLPIKLIKKRKLDLLDIETQQPNNVITIKLPRDDIVRRAQTPLCKSMVQLHSRPLNDDELFNLTSACDQFGPLDHLMISSDHPLQKIKDKQTTLNEQRMLKRTNLRTSRSTGVIHQKSIANNLDPLNHLRIDHQLNASHLESNHYCCTNISTGLTEMVISTANFENAHHHFMQHNTTNNTSIPSQLALANSTTTVIKKCSSCSNNTLTCTCSSSCTEPIYMLPTTREQTVALSLEYPSNVVAINTDEVQFTRMSSFRKSLIHSDFCIKRKKLKLGNKENSSKLKRRNTICESTCHQRNCNLVHCSKKRCNSSKNTKHCDHNQSPLHSSKLDKHSERRRSTGSINLIDSCCQTDLSFLDSQSKSTNPLTATSSSAYNTSAAATGRRSINRKSSSASRTSTQVQAEVHSSSTTTACKNKQRVPIYEKMHKKAHEADERSSSWSAASSTCATSSTTKSPTQNEDVVKRSSYSECSLAATQQHVTSELCKNNSETNVINSAADGHLQFRSTNQQAGKLIANRDSESWLQFFESCTESSDTITNELNPTLTNESTATDKQKIPLKQLHQKDQLRIKYKQSGCNLNKRNPTDLASISSSNNFQEHEDELLSIHSEDTDGYYTSMHTDSGLFRERAQELIMNSTFLAKDDDETTSEQQTNSENQPTISTKQSLDQNRKEVKKAPPSPPPRSCSVVSNTSTLNNVQQLTTCSVSNRTNTFDEADDQQDSSSVCSDATLSGHTNSSSQPVNSASTNNSTTNANQQTNGLPKVNNNNNNEQLKQQQAHPLYAQHSSIKSPSPANTWCSSMNSDIDLIKLRTKTTIDATSAYPSMVAYPDSELSSLLSFGNLAFASSGNHRCTVISKSRSASDNQQLMNNYNFNNQYVNTASYVANGQTPSHQSSKRDSTSSLDSKMSKRSLSTIGSYASLTKLKELLRPLRNSLMGHRSSEKKASKDQRDSSLSPKKKQSQDDCLTDETKSPKRKGFFTRFGSINRGKIVKSHHLEKLQSNETAPAPENNDMIKLRNTINKWRIEPINQEQQQANKVLNKTNNKEQSTKQFAEEDENEYYAKLSEQSSNILRNSVDFSLNNDLKRYSIASNHSLQSGHVQSNGGNCSSYLYKKHQQQQSHQPNNLSNLPLTSDLNPTPTNSTATANRNSLNQEQIENRRSSDSAVFTKLFPISRYTSKVQPEEHHFIVPSLPTPTYYENLNNARFSYSSSDNGSNSLGLSNNSSALYATIPSRPKTLNLSASYNQPFMHQQQNYGQTMLSNSYNCPFNSSLNVPFYSHQQQPIVAFNGQSLNSSTSSSFYSTTAQNNAILASMQQQAPTRSMIPISNNVNYLNTNHPHPVYQTVHHQTVNHPQISSSSHQSTPSSSYLSSAASSLVNTPSSMTSSVSPFHHQTTTSQQVNQQATIKQMTNHQFRGVAPSTTTNTAIVSPFCKQPNNNAAQSTDSLKKSDEKLNLKDKRSIDDSAISRTLTNNSNQIMFRDSMRLTRQQREQTLARIQQHRSSWTPSSSSPSESLGSSSNSSDQSTPCNDINKLINELSNFDDAHQPATDQSVMLRETQEQHHGLVNGKSDPIYGVNIARTRFVELKQSNAGTNINDFKKLLSTKTPSNQMNGSLRKFASEQLKITRKPLSALEAVSEHERDSNCQTSSVTGDYYEKETYDNVTDEEFENHFKRENMIGLMNGDAGQQHLMNGFNNNLRTRVINGRVYKTPYRLEAMHYPPINENEEDLNAEDGEFIVTNTQQNTSTWV